MSYDDGAEYRDQNTHPAWNDTSCKQHRLNDFRNQLSLYRLYFPSEIKLSTTSDELNMTF